MLLIFSPATTMEFESPLPFPDHTQPRFLDETAELVAQLRPLSAADLAALMDLSDDLAQLNAERWCAAPF